MTACFIGALGACIGIGAGLLGAGTSFLTVLLLVHVAGLSMGRSIATSLVVVAATSIVALVPYARARAVMWRAGAAFSVTSMIGAFVGGRMSTGMPARALLAIFAMAMVAAALVMLRTPRLPSDGERARSSRAAAFTIAAAGLPIGGLTGIVGLGGGFAVLPLLLLFTSASARAAVGTTLLVVVLNTLAGLAGHFPNPAVDWPLAAFVSVTASVGSLLGARLGTHVDPRTIRRAFAALMLATALALLGSAFAGRSG